MITGRDERKLTCDDTATTAIIQDTLGSSLSRALGFKNVYYQTQLGATDILLYHLTKVSGLH